MLELTRVLGRVALLALPLWLGAEVPAAAQAQAQQQVQTPFAPVAVVNGVPITGFDLEQRMRLLQVLADPGADPATLSRAALEQLIGDRLKIQEGQRRGIVATEESLATGLQRFVEGRGMTVEDLLGRLQRAGVTELALRDLIGAEVVWLELVRSRFEAAAGGLEAEAAQPGQTGPVVAYRLQEIGIPAPAGAEAEARAQAERLAAELAQGGDFTAAVRQYSRAPSAARGGEIGWIDASRLPPEMAATLASLQPGQVSPPIPIGAGYSIVRLLEVRQGQAQAAAASPEQRMGQLAEGLMQELRRDALIERR